MQIHQRGEDEEAGGEVVVKQLAGQPRSGDEQRDASCDKDAEVGEWPPIRPLLSVGFTASVVAGDPEILCGVHHGQYARTEAALRNAKAFAQRQSGGEQEPYK